MAILRPLHQCFCRNQFVRRFGPGRFWLECAACGYETAGIQVRSRTTAVAAPSPALANAVIRLFAMERHT